MMRLRTARIGTAIRPGLCRIRPRCFSVYATRKTSSFCQVFDAVHVGQSSRLDDGVMRHRAMHCYLTTLHAEAVAHLESNRPLLVPCTVRREMVWPRVRSRALPWKLLKRGQSGCSSVAGPERCYTANHPPAQYASAAHRSGRYAGRRRRFHRADTVRVAQRREACGGLLAPPKPQPPPEAIFGAVGYPAGLIDLGTATARDSLSKARTISI